MKRPFKKLVHVLVLLPLLLMAQTVPDSAAVDSLPVPPKKHKRSTLKSPIKYWAESITLHNKGDIIELQGAAKIEYQTMGLTAAYIKIDQRKKVLYAYGLPDSVDVDSQLVVSGKPVFTEAGQEPLLGDSIAYNFETERGRIVVGKTEMPPGFYRGARIHRIADSTMLIRDGIFTSCEYIDHPHFYFQSERIRLKVKDKVIAEPITFYIADVPLGWLPFGVFPNKRGRHSGIVIPSYGESIQGGRFLRGLGYYWAPNDYFDATFLSDFYDKLGFAYRASARYTKRYKYNGSVSAEYYPRDPRSGGNSTRWQMRFNHRQIIDPTMSLNGSGSFVSDRKFSRDLSPNIDERLNQNITSNLTFTKKWQGTKNSMSASVSRNENLQTGSVSYVFPSISFNRSKSSLYETITGNKLGSKRNWYQSIYFNYSSSLIHKGARTVLNDSTETESSTEGIQHRLSFSAPQKILRYVNISPNLSITEDWVDEIQEAWLNPETNKVEGRAKKQFAARHSFNAGVSAKTTVYGMFEPNIGSLKYIRHKMDPTVSFTYKPDFSDDFYGYFSYADDTSGQAVAIDKFGKSPYGSTGRFESRSVGLSLNNLFQGKLIDEQGKETKLDLLTLNFSSAYNFMADSLRWSDLSATARTRVLGKDISLRMIYDVYQRNANGAKINALLAYPKLRTLSTALSFNISNKTFAAKKEQRKTNTPGEEAPQGEGVLAENNNNFKRRDLRQETKNISTSWSTSFSFDYAYNRLAAAGVNPHRLNLGVRANMQLTRNWKISWNGRFDLVKKNIVYHSFNIYRDLHCWEMSFGWQPTRQYYDFRINIKSSMLQDIKITKHPRNSTFLR